MALYPDQHGLLHNGQVLPNDAVRQAELLSMRSGDDTSLEQRPSGRTTRLYEQCGLGYIQ